MIARTTATARYRAIIRFVAPARYGSEMFRPYVMLNRYIVTNH